MTHETKTKLKAPFATGYIVLTTCLGIAFFRQIHSCNYHQLNP
jgi:hypothetical protein